MLNTGVMTSNADFLSQLNDSQRAAVEFVDGPSLVIAGAGSGKTRVLTYKIAFLLQQGMKPWNILALTFTNKAAKEMKTRIGGLVGEAGSQYLQMGTFHSVFSRILRIEAEHIGYNANYTIYDETDSRSLIKNIIKGLNLDEKKYKPATLHNRISMAKNHLISSADYALDRSALQRDAETRMPEISMIYSAYQARLEQANAMDFDDLLMNTYRLFRDNDDIRRKYAEQYQFVLVDEYQDTNFAQQSIVLQLVKEHHRICVVGDDAQSIYAFRGANIDNILDFQKHFTDSRMFKLEQNYRSTQRIVQAANSLIRHNQRQIHKDVYSHNAEGEKIIYKPAYSDKEEAMIVCNEIQRIKRQDLCEYSDFAILYRTNAQSRAFEEEMRKKGIPYRIYGGLSFYQRKEIKDIIAYFRLVANPNDEEAFRRVINYPTRGIGNTTIQKILLCSQKHQVGVWDVITHPLDYGLDLNRGTLSKIEAFRNMMMDFQTKSGMTDVFVLGQEIIKVSGIYADLYSSNEPEAIARQENLEEFVSGMQDFVEIAKEEGREKEIFLSDFLQDVALLTDLDSSQRRESSKTLSNSLPPQTADSSQRRESGKTLSNSLPPQTAEYEDGESSKVSLMTIHSAKGLEFPTVFIVGLEENIFPSQLSVNSKRELEEERRLFYVAITRAEKHCILTNAKSRFRYGRMEFDSPSRFLNDIDPQLIKVEGEDARPYKTLSNSLPSATEDYEHNKPYTGSRPWGNEWQEMSSRIQNSRPVASQFRADPKPKITSPRHPEAAIDPFSEAFKRKLVSAGGNLRRVNEAIGNGGRTVQSSISSSSNSSVKEGNIIEHQRFGVGTVLKLEGSGENTKATVEFRNAGTKQLLLKFARFKVIS